jgi:hypothetical protein
MVIFSISQIPSPSTTEEVRAAAKKVKASVEELTSDGDESNPELGEGSVSP